jgi:hypothetical protein
MICPAALPAMAALRIVTGRMNVRKSAPVIRSIAAASPNAPV